MLSVFQNDLLNLLSTQFEPQKQYIIQTNLLNWWN